MGEKKFNGILLPYICERFGIGAVIGIAIRELQFGPESLRISIAHPKDESLSSIGLFQLDGCADRGQYCQRACCYWLLPEFSKVRDLSGGVVARIRPSVDGNSRYAYDFIFWADGKPVPVGHQFTVGHDSFSRRLRNGRSLHDVIRAWEQGEVDTDFNKTVKETLSIIDTGFGDEYIMKLNRLRDEYEEKSRDAVWEAKRGLLVEVV